MEALRLEADISQVEEDKVTLSNELIEMNREALAWEKKIQMCVEAKQTLDKERSEGGEVGNMKAEIHRMEVSSTFLILSAKNNYIETYE